MHDMQELFASAEGEDAWTREMQDLFNCGALDRAEAVLSEALTALDSELSRKCLRLKSTAVELTGWEELAEAIEVHEGDPVTALTIAIVNDTDRAFEKGETHHPHVMMGLYTDEFFDFSGADRAAVFAELGEEIPAWAGYEEDIEVHFDIEGLDDLNTALLHHKQRHFFRDGKPEMAPERYIEYVLACWWRALRWHQAVAGNCAGHPLPGAPCVVAGMVDMRTEAVGVYRAGTASEKPVAAPASAASNMADAFGDSFIRRDTLVEEEKPMTGSELRRKSLETEANKEPERKSLFARIFGR
ncbi:hypothetical protein [Qipengyuania sp. DGS5-3]|uniref:hypothetical protein n=1 Tax=Qipengyuania sp. DGS5-3 TaxID=3349632 RepID=UPI0036D40D1A